MLAKFSIDYVALPQHHSRTLTHHTDDPVAAEEFLMLLLVARAKVTGIRHEGAPLGPTAVDHMLKIAAERVASELLRDSLGISAADVRARFGLAA